MNQEESFFGKWEKIKNLIINKRKDCLILSSQSNVTWLIGGRSYINIATVQSPVRLLVFYDEIYLIVNNIEAQRIYEEEIAESIQPYFHVKQFLWHETGGQQRIVDELLIKKHADVLDELQCFNELKSLQWKLDLWEQASISGLARDTAQAVEKVAMSSIFGMSELEVAGRLSFELWSRGIEPIVILVAGDLRNLSRRHPLPTINRLDSDAILVVSGRKYGLVVSVTRSVHKGKLPIELIEKQQSVAYVDAVAIINSRPGITLDRVLQAMIQEYVRQGYQNEWENHHQGGIAGYQSRVELAMPGNNSVLEDGMVVAWNPTISGVKSEDTCLISSKGARVISETCNHWPMITISVGGSVIERPNILEC